MNPNKLSHIVLVILLLVIGSNHGRAQGYITVNDYMHDYLRLLEIKGKHTNNSMAVYFNQFDLTSEDSTSSKSSVWNEQMKFYRETTEEGFQLTLLSPALNTNFSSKYARSYNDGPMWNGRGISTGINAGFKASYGPLKLIFFPNFSYSQNRPFELQDSLLNRSEYNYQLESRIDWVQRFGDGSFSEFNLGQSNISVTTGPVIFKFSTENMLWGPGLFNQILMSNTTAGFPHVNIGTPKPVLTKIGDFELNLFWGQLKESNHFDGIDQNNRRFLSSWTFGYRPSFSKFLKGFSFGLSRVLYQIWPESGLSGGDLLLGFKNFGGSPTILPNGSVVNDNTDQMISLNTRWIFDESGVEIYFVYARSDFWLDFKDLVSEPDHGASFNMGFQKTFETHGSNFWRLGFEHTSLATTNTVEIRPSHSIYLHTIVNQGYTHNGQLIGAGIGPGARSQWISLDKFSNEGKIGFFFTRISFNNDFVIEESRRTGNEIASDIELNLGFNLVRFLGNYELSGKIIYSRRKNWNFTEGNDVSNFQLLTGVRWHFARAD